MDTTILEINQPNLKEATSTFLKKIPFYAEVYSLDGKIDRISDDGGNDPFGEVAIETASLFSDCEGMPKEILFAAKADVNSAAKKFFSNQKIAMESLIAEITKDCDVVLGGDNKTWGDGLQESKEKVSDKYADEIIAVEKFVNAIYGSFSDEFNQEFEKLKGTIDSCFNRQEIEGMSTALENYQASLDACRKNMEPDLTEYKSICSRFNSSSTICKSNLQNKFNDICSLWVHKKVSYLINKAKQFLVPDPNCLVPLKRINGAKDCLSEINRISDKTLPTDLEKEIDNTESKIENATGVLADLVKILFYVTSIKVEIFTENHLFSTQDYYSFTECDVRKKISLLNLYDNTFLYNLVGMLRKGFEGSDPLECEDFCAFLSFYVEDMMNPKYVFVGDGSQDLKSKTVDWLRNTLPRVCIALFYLPGGCSRDETHHSAKEVITLSLGRTLASSLNKLDAIGNGYYWNNLSKHSK